MDRVDMATLGSRQQQHTLLNDGDVLLCESHLLSISILKTIYNRIGRGNKYLVGGRSKLS